MGSLVQDYHEVQKSIFFGIPGVYLNGDIPEDKVVFLKLKVEFSDIMCDVDPNHIPNM